MLCCYEGVTTVLYRIRCTTLNWDHTHYQIK